MLSSRASVLEESVIREMTRLSQVHNALNLSQGMPDDPVPKPMKDAVLKALNEEDDQYSFTWGKKCLRDEVARWMSQRYGLDYEPDSEITITCGVSEGIIAAVGALVEKDRKVLLFEPVYENYHPGAVMASAKPLFVPPSNLSPSGVEFDHELVKDSFAQDVALVVLNSPHNPSGWVMDDEFMKLVRDLCVDNNVIALTDEIYSEMLYDGKKHRSLATMEGMWDRTVVLNGASKTFGATGWRVGWACAPERLSVGIRRYHDYMTICAPTPFQAAVVEGLRMGEDYYENLRSVYTRRRDRFVPGLEKLGFECIQPQGAYYVFAGFDGIAPKDWDDWDFGKHLVSEEGVATVPGSSFFFRNKEEPETGFETGKRWLRFTFSRSDTLLDEALVRLERRLGAINKRNDLRNYH